MREDVLNILTSHGVREAKLFGTAARSEDHVASDLDIVIDAPKGTTYLDIVRMETELAELLGFPVEITTSGALSHDFAARIAPDVKTL